MITATQYGIMFVSFLLVPLAYSIWLIMRRRTSALLPMLASAVSTLIMYILLTQYAQSSSLQMLYIELGIAITASIMAELYLAKPRLFISSVALLMLWFLLYFYSGFMSFAPIGVFGFSTAYGLIYRTANDKHMTRQRRERSKETRRDVVQVILGLMLVILLVSVSLNLAVPLIFALMVLGYIINNLVAEKSLSKLLKPAASMLERTESLHGSGALYVAAGTALILGFVNNLPGIMFGVFVLFFADPAATIIGIRFGSQRFLYNQSKSALGTLAFYIVAASLGYVALGFSAPILAVPLTFIESTDTPLDDNLVLAVAIVALAIFAGL